MQKVIIFLLFITICKLSNISKNCCSFNKKMIIVQVIKFGKTNPSSLYRYFLFWFKKTEHKEKDLQVT
jgi:hypothetical protein